MIEGSWMLWLHLSNCASEISIRLDLSRIISQKFLLKQILLTLLILIWDIQLICNLLCVPISLIIIARAL